MTPIDQVILEEAAKWFPDCEDLLIWAWDDAAPGCCHPLLVVAAWEDGMPFPPQVRAEPEAFLRRRLEDEWKSSDLDHSTLPGWETRADAMGRRAWRMDLSDCSEEVRIAVGRATMRGGDLPAWDFDWENLACPENSKTCVVSTDDGRYLYEPGEADLMWLMEELRPEPETPSYFMLLFRDHCYFQAWMHPEGVLAEIRVWHDIDARRFTHWRASNSPAPVPCRKLGDIEIAEENLLPLSVVSAMAMEFHAAPSALPRHSGVVWIVSEEGP